MRGLLFLLLLGVCASASSATVYKWVDDNGVVHYSDQPNPKAQKLEIADAQTYSSQSAKVAGPAAAAARPVGGAPPVCAIDTPKSRAGLSGHFFPRRARDAVTCRRSARAATGRHGHLRPAGAGRQLHADAARARRSRLTLQVTNAQGEVSCQANAVTFSIRQRAGAVGGPLGAPGAPAAPQAPRAPGVGAPH